MKNPAAELRGMRSLSDSRWRPGEIAVVELFYQIDVGTIGKTQGSWLSQLFLRDTDVDQGKLTACSVMPAAILCS
jgi:hypothetical protein